MLDSSRCEVRLREARIEKVGPNQVDDDGVCNGQDGESVSE